MRQRFFVHAACALLLLPCVIVGCASAARDGSEPPTKREPADANPTYVPPADRIDPVVASGFTVAQFAALGEARSGADGHGEVPTTRGSRYVSANDGSDDNDGSESAPWKTLQHAADEVGPGTTVYVDDSGDYAGGLRITRGGEVDAWIVFTPRVPGSAPRLVGGLDRAAVVEINASWVVFHGFEIADHDRGSLSRDEIGVHIEPVDGDISHVRVLNNHIHHIGPQDADGDRCDYDAHGIIAQSEGWRIANLIIDGNELHDLYVGSSECLVLNGLIERFQVTNNYIHDVNNIAIDIIGYEKRSDETTSFGLVADNVVLDASNYWPYCGRGNCAYPAGDESSDGIYVDGGAGMEIAYNVVGRADHGIELQSENGALIRDVEVHHNVVFNSNYKQITIGPSDNVTQHDNVELDEAALANAALEACR